MSLPPFLWTLLWKPLGSQSIGESSPFNRLMNVSFSLKPYKVSTCSHSYILLIVHLIDHINFNSNTFHVYGVFSSGHLIHCAEPC